MHRTMSRWEAREYKRRVQTAWLKAAMAVGLGLLAGVGFAIDGSIVGAHAGECVQWGLGVFGVVLILSYGTFNVID